MPSSLYSETQRIEGSFNKDPQADLPYGFDWARWLPSGRAIASSIWASSPSGLTLHSDSVDGPRTSIFLAGGDVGAAYIVTNHIMSDGAPPLIDDRSFLIRVINR